MNPLSPPLISIAEKHSNPNARADQPEVRDLVLDASCFLNRARFSFLTSLLSEEELSPSRLILPDDLYDLFTIYVKEERFTDRKRALIAELVAIWEYPGSQLAVLEWMQSSEFRGKLGELFTGWKIVPAREVVSNESSPSNFERITQLLGNAGRLLRDELLAAKQTKTFLLGLTRRIVNVLKKIRLYLIEFPLAKKREFMQKHG